MSEAVMSGSGGSAFDAIERLKDLPEGWDSYQAPRVADAARGRAKLCLRSVREHLSSSYWNPLVGPTPDGGVTLLWRKGNGPEVDILCSATGARYVLLSRGLIVQRGEVTDFALFATEVLKRLDL
jgi:hypothetical protein